MGYVSALAFSEAVENDDISLDVALHWHLRSNHFPPVPLELIPVAKAAISALEEGDPDRDLELPANVTFRDRPVAPAWTVIQQFHLDAFLSADDAWEDADVEDDT